MTDRPSLLGVQDATLDAFTLLVPAVGIATAWIAGESTRPLANLRGQPSSSLDSDSRLV